MQEIILKSESDNYEWINQKQKKLLSSNIPINTIFFLYGFLGDDYEIERKEYINNLKLWKKKNIGYEIKIIREKYDEIEKLVQLKFPNFYLTYKNYPQDIQRCDIIRYMLMYNYGGIYSDLDVKPIYSIEKILFNIKSNNMNFSWANIIFGIARIKDKKKCEQASKYESIRKGEPEIPIKLSNYFFLSRVKQHPIWLDILNLAQKRSQIKVKSQYGIIYSTGPDLVTTALSNNRHKYNDIAIIPIDIFKKIVKHSCSGSWRNTNVLKECETNINTT